MGTAVILGFTVGLIIDWLTNRWPQRKFEPSAAWLRLLVGGGTAVLYAILWQRLGFSSNFAFLAGLVTFLMLLATIDLKHRLVPNSLILPATGLMLLYQFIPLSQGSWLALGGAAVALLLFGLVHAISPGGLGGGDVKLAAFLGATFGLPYLFWALLAGGLVGGGTAVLLLLDKKRGRKTHIPYAPFLCLGGIVALLVNPLPWLMRLF